MAKIINGAVISGTVPKMFETTDTFIINGQVYDKITLEPMRFKTIPIGTTYTDSYMDMHATPDVSKNTEMYDSGNVITDKYQSEFSYSICMEKNGYLQICKFKTTESAIEKIYQVRANQTTGASISIYCQDVGFIYGTLTTGTSLSQIFKIDKSTGDIVSCDIGSNYSKLKLIKDTPLFIYYAYSRAADKFAIGKYNKSSNSKTDIFTDNGSKAADCYTFSSPMAVSEGEILAIRSNVSFNPGALDKLTMKKYLIDYAFDKVYSKEVNLDCSLLPKGMIMKINDSVNWNQTFLFTIGDNVYFTLWNRSDRMLYLFKKISDANYSVIQQYELTQFYNGVMPYNDGKTLMFFKDSFIEYISFRQLEEKFELASVSAGYYASLCVDRNKIIWLQHKDSTIEMIGLNVPTIAEALFTDTDLSYANTDIDTFIEVFTKNFDGTLVTSDVEVILSGPIKFTETGLARKKIKTSTSSILRVPVTVTNSGYVEANISIL